MRGFDPFEVNAYMARVSKEVELQFSDFQDVKKKLKQYEVELLEYKEREDLLKKTLSNATKMSDKIQSDSSREAKLIISDAQHRAEMITRDAKDSLKRIYQDISDLRRIRLQFENNLKAILNSHIAMLEQGQRTIPDPVVDETKLKVDLKNLDPKIMNMDSDSDEEVAEMTSPAPELDL